MAEGVRCCRPALEVWAMSRQLVNTAWGEERRGRREVRVRWGEALVSIVRLGEGGAGVIP